MTENNTKNRIFLTKQKKLKKNSELVREEYTRHTVSFFHAVVYSSRTIMPPPVTAVATCDFTAGSYRGGKLLPFTATVITAGKLQ